MFIFVCQKKLCIQQEKLNIFMLDLSLIEENQIKDILRVPLSQLSDQEVTDLALTLFPLQTLANPIDLFYKNLWTFYNIRIEKKVQFQVITQQVLNKAKQKGINIHSVLQIVFKGEFMEKFKKRLLKSRGLIKPPPKNQIQKTTAQNDDGTERKVFAFGGPKEETQTKIISEVTTALASSDNRSVSSKNSNKVIANLKENPSVSSTSKVQISTSNVVTEGGAVVNLSDQVMCFCGKHVSLIDPFKQISLLCIHCNKRYHTQCTKRSTDSKICPFCHLKKLIPNRQAKKVLFVGLLQKGRKKHDISFYLTESDLSIQFKIQVRCFRIKQGCNNFILFPDSSTFYIRNINVKEFIPIHRQSSLKYRKDQPFYITSGLHSKENKLTVIEKHPNKENKDDRIVLQNHLLGIYLIEEKKNDWLIREYKENNFTGFGESKQLLDNLFENGSIGDEICCQVIKIPLTCSLTTQRIKIPARGSLCNHFQCFDLKNYLDLITNSTNPRWLCPLCKLPCYEFKLDVILFNILELYKNKDNISEEVIFVRTGEFKIFLKDGQEMESQIKNIYNLPIESKFKRVPPESVDFGQMRKK